MEDKPDPLLVPVYRSPDQVDEELSESLSTLKLLEKIPPELVSRVVRLGGEDFLGEEVPVLQAADYSYTRRNAFLIRCSLVNSTFRDAAQVELHSHAFIHSLTSLRLFHRTVVEKGWQRVPKIVRLRPDCRQERHEWAADQEAEIITLTSACQFIEDLTLSGIDRVSLDFVQRAASRLKSLTLEGSYVHLRAFDSLPLLPSFPNLTRLSLHRVFVEGSTTLSHFLQNSCPKIAHISLKLLVHNVDEICKGLSDIPTLRKLGLELMAIGVEDRQHIFLQHFDGEKIEEVTVWSNESALAQAEEGAAVLALLKAFTGLKKLNVPMGLGYYARNEAQTIKEHCEKENIKLHMGHYHALFHPVLR